MLKLSILRCAILWCCLLAFFITHLPVALGDEFFGNQLSERERHWSDATLGGMEESIEKISTMQMLIMYQAFAQGRCDEYFNVETAAKAGDGKSQYILSDLYRKGYCVPQDDGRAFHWLSESATGGYDESYYDMGVFLANGIGTAKNPRAAHTWFEKASASRPDSFYQLALLYWAGTGVTQNFSKAFEYAERGAELGDPAAQSVTAVLQAQEGFEFYDPVSAYKWVLIARASGRENIEEVLSEVATMLEGQLDTRQITLAQSDALDFTPESLGTTAKEDPTNVQLPNLDTTSILDLSKSEAADRLKILGLERDRFLFFKAIEEDNLGVTALYIRAGASPETRSPTMFDTALLYAARNGSEQVARYLVSSGADINRSVNDDNDTPVLLALSGGYRDLAEYLIGAGASLDHPGIMYNAVEYDDPKLLELLRSKGVPIDLDYVGTPLSHAVSAMDDDGNRKCYSRSAAYLISQGASTEGRGFLGDSLLQDAIETINPIECVRLLLENGAKQDSAAAREPLFIAVIYGHSGVVELLLKHGADPNLTYNLEADKVPMIFEADAKSTVMNNGSILQLAVVEHHAAITRHLVRYGADPNAADKLGRTPLSIATDRGDSLMVSVLNGDM